MKVYTIDDLLSYGAGGLDNLFISNITEENKHNSFHFYVADDVFLMLLSGELEEFFEVTSLNYTSIKLMQKYVSETIATELDKINNDGNIMVNDILYYKFG